MKKKSTMDVLYMNEKELSIGKLQKETKQAVIKVYKDNRKNQKLTQIDMSHITGIPQPNITRFESDKSNPTLEMLVKMAAALNMRLSITLEALPEGYIENNCE